VALIDKILALTEQVQQYVDDGRWGDAGVLETERLALLTELFACDSVADLGVERERLAQDLLARNTGMIEKLQTQRTRLNEATRRLNAAPRAVDAYRSNVPVVGWGCTPDRPAVGSIEQSQKNAR